MKAIVERGSDDGTDEAPYLGEIPVLYYGEQIGVIADEDGLGRSFRFTPPAEEDAS